MSGLGDPAAGIFEVHGVLLDADAALSSQNGGDAGGAAAHERVEDGVGLNGITDVADLSERARARYGVAARVAIPPGQVGHVPIAGQFIVNTGATTPVPWTAGTRHWKRERKARGPPPRRQGPRAAPVDGDVSSAELIDPPWQDEV